MLFRRTMPGRKRSRYYEDEPVADSSIEDIDMDFVASYCRKIGYAKSPEEYIRQNKSYIVTKSGRLEMGGAAILTLSFITFISAPTFASVPS